MKIPPKRKHWELDFRLPKCPVCYKRALLLGRKVTSPFFKWTCNKCGHEVEYG